MIKFNIISIFPEMITQALSYGVVGRGIKDKKLSVKTINLRDFANDKYQTVDDKPYGGGDGMLLKPEPMTKAIESLGIKEKNQLISTDKTQGHKVVYLSPQGSLWTDAKAKKWVKECKELTFICGRYGGLDQRIIDLYIDEEISIGDYVLSGGELPALALVDSISRFIPDLLGHEDSAHEDSFNQGLLEAPQFTRPAIFKSLPVPEVLVSGDHQKIKQYKKDLSISVTQAKRPDLYKQYLSVSKSENASTSFMKEKKPGLNLLSIALMHSGVLNKKNQDIVTTLTHFDIHDIARSAKTYNLKKYFIVNPIPEQLSFLSRVLEHWRLGRDQGLQRSKALSLVRGESSFESMFSQFSSKPFVVCTSAKVIEDLPSISVEVLAQKIKSNSETLKTGGTSPQEILLIFGTGCGLSPKVSELCDAVLEPIDTGSGFNHLSVRSAVSILLDRLQRSL